MRKPAHFETIQENEYDVIDVWGKWIFINHNYNTILMRRLSSYDDGCVLNLFSFGE